MHKALLVLFLYFSGTSVLAKPPTTEQMLPLEDLQRFTAVVEQIRQYYVKPIEDKELFENAIRGMLTGLDPHSAYLDPAEFSELKANTSGTFGGLGIEVTMEEGFVLIISPIDDTPAQRAGMKPGDLIVKIEDSPIKGMSLKKAVEMMRGEPGSPITLTLIRKGEQAPIKMTLTRETIHVKSVRHKLLDDNYGYIRISQFQTHTGADLVKATEALQKETQQQLRGVILDLRNNPGGILEASVSVADAFLNSPKHHQGLIVYTEGRLPGTEIKEFTHDGDILNGAPIVVLVNGGSASAAEIVAGALQDHKRALIIGTPTFGKGSVQTVLPLKDNHGLKLTTALYYTPSGRSIQAQGILPDIEVPDLKLPEVKQSEVEDLINIREANLQGHLENDTKNDTKKNTKKEGSPPPNKIAKDTAKAFYQDYQLVAALNILKSLALLEPQTTPPALAKQSGKR